VKTHVLVALVADPPPGLAEAENGVRYTFASTEIELRKALPSADVLFAWKYGNPIYRSLWSTAARLRWVHVAGIGVDSLLVPEFVESDVVLTNCRGAYDRTMSEYAIALMLYFAKDFAGTIANQRVRTWKPRLTESLYKKRVLIVGVGTIGRAIAFQARSLGMAVSAVGRTRRKGDSLLDEVLVARELPDRIVEADFVVVCAPLTRETEGLLNRGVLEKIKPTAFLINLGRGATIDEEALVELLTSRRIAGAALDVFRNEPLPPDSPLWGLDNVFISPHMSGDTSEYKTWFVESFLENLRRWQAGIPLMNIVDKRLGFVTEAPEAS
jgi:phosphoglycerate dehydrogenase-like enzyme